MYFNQYSQYYEYPKKAALLSLGLFLLVVGLYLIASYDGWQQAIGAFMLIWSHNIDNH